MRESDVEQFEDDPLEFIRLDLALSATGTDLGTRRHAAADVLQALVGAGFESETTEIVGNWINQGLSQYQTNKEANWKAKDSAIFLLTAIATRGSTSQVRGCTVGSTPADLGIARSYVDECACGRCQVLLRPCLPGPSSCQWDCSPHSSSRCYSILVHLPKPTYETPIALCSSAPCGPPQVGQLCHLYLRCYYYR
jgi:hypothetical protein